MNANSSKHVFEEIQVTEMTVKCNGGGGALGHPAVYLTLEKSGKIVCPYCSRTYIRSPQNSSEN
jgi:uncharacterized Zn-finger protein